MRFPYKYRQVMAAVLIGMAAVFAPVAEARWETLRTERTDVRSVAHDKETELKTTRGVIQITTNRPVQVKIFTILGRLVSNETVPAGTSQFQVKAHGVYIVKAGDLTCKVSL